MKNFVKKGELQLVNGGYLVNKEEVAVSNVQFVAMQKSAEYIITFAKLAKGKDFEGKPADTLQSLKEEVANALSKKATEFVAGPLKPEGDLTAKLTKEALAFVSFREDVSKTEKINKFLQSFETLREFEEFGLFFTEDVVKLNAIYTLEEVVAAVSEVIELLN